MAPLIELSSTSKIYPMPGGDVHALRGVDLQIEQGEFLSIIGSSGSGKTTLLYLLGLLTRASSGNYRLEGREMDQLCDRDLSAIRGSKIGFVFQSFHLVPQLSVIENVRLAARYAPGLNGVEAKRKSQQLIERVGLSSRAKHLPGELSGGEMQRVAIARALLNEPSIILADEPTGNLDETTGSHIFELLQGLVDQGRTVVVVTHEMALADKTQRRIRLRDGATVDEVSRITA